MDYESFIERKRIFIEPSGFDVTDKDIDSHLFPFQRDIVRWALRLGKSAVFGDCGTGKAHIELEWAKQVVDHAGKPVIIFAPLAVSHQTARIGESYGYPVHVSRTQEDIEYGINITNYEKIHHYEPEAFSGIVIDESSILKAQFGKMRHQITSFASVIPYRLAGTATPAPNDLIELVNHAEFLGVMSEREIMALFFTQDGNSSNKFRLKRHAQEDFWKWLALWSVAFRKPSDLGYEDGDFILPSLKKHRITVGMNNKEMGTLFPMEALTLEDQRASRRASLTDRVAEAANLVNSSNESWLIWCDLNDESTSLAKAIPDAIEVTGSDSETHKEDAMIGFSEGRYRVLVSKPSIAGFGMNWQHCHNVIFVGISHSYEMFYQAIRRTWRFGQKNPVHVYVITSEVDGPVIENIDRKEKQAMDMYEQIVYHMRPHMNFDRVSRDEMVYEESVESGRDWTLYLGDSVKTIRHIGDDSIGLSVFSPPFPGMYVYTNSPHDMGNVSDMEQMIDQFSYLMDKKHLYRVLMPGRSVFIHITQGVAQKGRDGYMGIKDFRGKIISMMSDIGWIHYGEITIDKNPQLKAMRTKDHGLMFKSLVSDSSRMHVALADMLLQFRKPGDNPVPIKAGKTKRYASDGWVTDNEWINWARPVWYGADYEPGTWKPDYTGDSCPDGISETDVLNVRVARETNDERHLCPLQIGVIDRVVKLWSAPGETVYSPFAGIGSEGYSSIRLGRKFIGGELKKSYWMTAINNLRSAELENGSTLFDF